MFRTADVIKPHRSHADITKAHRGTLGRACVPRLPQRFVNAVGLRQRVRGAMCRRVSLLLRAKQ